MAKTKKNLYEGNLNQLQQNYIGQFKSYVRVEGTSVIIEILFPTKRDAEDCAEHIRHLRD